MMNDIENKTHIVFTPCMAQEVPLLKKVQHDATFTLRMNSDLKRDLECIKETYHVDVSEWLRRIIMSELPKLKSRIVQNQ